jgi:hypothetical protein
MIEQIEKRQKKVDEFHRGLKELNLIDEPSFFNDVFMNKKLEEHEEVMEAVELTKKAIQHLRLELIDKVITNRDKCTFDVRMEFVKVLTEYDIFTMVKEALCEDIFLEEGIKKIEITKGKILGGFYEK